MKLAIALLLLLSPGLAHAAGPTCNSVWTDAGRSNRKVPVRIRMPAGSGKAPVILFSHGLGGSLDSGRVWAQAWAEAGFLVVNIQHPGSDREIIPDGKWREAMRPAQLIARAQDVHFVIDRLARGGGAGACDLARADMTRIGMSGHSFGAHTTQAIAGQHYPFAGGDTLADHRVKAAIAFSPSPPALGSAERAFGTIAIPFFSITGTEDSVPITPWVKPADRIRPFEAMPAGGKYLLVLDGANHMAFNGRGDHAAAAAALSPHVEAVVRQATIDFWRWTLMGDADARRKLDGHAFPLSAKDRFAKR